MKRLNIAILKLTLYLIIGILLTEFIAISLLLSFSIASLLTFISCLLYFFFKDRQKHNYLFGVSTYLTFIALGVFISNSNNPKHQNTHYTYFTTSEQAQQTITFKITEHLKINNYNQRYYAKILKINNHFVKGKILVNIKKDALHPLLNTDEVYLTKTYLKSISPALNPDQFDYKNYLERQQVYHQIQVTNNTLLQLNNTTNTVFGYAAKFRNLINLKIKPYQYSDDQTAIINALLLGQKQNISKDLSTNYINAGAIHILAVSGLHIGMILLALNFLFKPIQSLKKRPLVKTLLLIILLWAYAIIAGGAASIIRATTMFSIVAIGINLKQPSNIYNTIAVSAFILLLIKPYYLFDIGFQLSYAAVIAIISFKPLFDKIWTPKHKATHLLWQTLSVTLAAQIGVTPLCLYYFHQFPSLFWLSNLVIIPFLNLIFGLGLLVIASALIGVSKSILTDSFGTVINWMNYFFEWVARQEDFLITDIPFTGLQVIISYCLIICTYQLLTLKNAKWLKRLLVFVISLQSTYIYNTLKTQGNYFLIFQKTGNTLIGQKNNNKLAVYSNSDNVRSNAMIRAYAVKNSLKTITDLPLQSVYKTKKGLLLIVDSLGVYNIKGATIDYVLLTQSPKINLRRLIDSIQPRLIIADGSNYNSYCKQWETICKKQKLPFYQTGKIGAYILND